MIVNASHINFPFNPNELAADGEPTAADPGTEPGTAPETEPVMTYLTPDALLSYCKARLDGLDSQIQQDMQTQQDANYDQQDIQPIQALLAQNADGCKDQSAVNALVAAVKQAIAEIQGRDPGSPALSGLNQMLSAIQGGTTTPDTATQIGAQVAQKMGATITFPDSLSSEQVKDLTTTLGQITSGESSAAEINMINLQSLMSQRQNAVELTTNMFQTLDETLNKVVSNV